MNTKTNTCLSVIVLMLTISVVKGQDNIYSYKRKINEVVSPWNRIILPEDVFSKLSPDLFDLRIYGINGNKDTIEAPYILEELSEQMARNQVEFKKLNFTNQGDKYYYTFEVPGLKEINQIVLSFFEKNFNRVITIEGSQNINDWFTIAKDYRIMSIVNEYTDYRFTDLKFQNSKFRYYRISFNSNTKPELSSAVISELKIIPGKYQNYEHENLLVQEDKKKNQTIITLDLLHKVPVSFIQVSIKDTIDYYRPIEIQYLSDSTKSPKGWVYYYTKVASGTLSSFEKNEFKFANTPVSKIKIIISNYDNEPLSPYKVLVKGNLYQLIFRNSGPAEYYLFYGSKLADKPIYDIANFKYKVPEVLPELSLGTEELLIQPVPLVTKALFENKIWLWSIMAAVILLLGLFTIRMLKK